MRRIIVVTNRSAESTPILRRHLAHQYPNHVVQFKRLDRTLRSDLSGQSTSDLPHLILLDHYDGGSDVLQSMRELKNDPVLGRVPVLMLTARATEKQLLSFL